jgi:hypothetical protein
MPPHPLPRSGVRRQSSANVARRLKAASSTANEKLEKLDIEPISDRVIRARSAERSRAFALRPVTIPSTSLSSSATRTHDSR